LFSAANLLQFFHSGKQNPDYFASLLQKQVFVSQKFLYVQSFSYFCSRFGGVDTGEGNKL